jgi:hypothetical protein
MHCSHGVTSRLAPLAFALAASFSSIVPLFPRAARAEGRPPAADGADTTHGRIDGDASLVLGAGLALGPRDPRAALDARLRYLDTAGVFVTYEDGRLFGSGADPARVLAGGIELRPLFLGRWLKGMELGHARADLLLDSLGVEVGGFLAQPAGGSFGQRPGLQIGLGLELPVSGAASGLWLGVHGGLRWSDAALSGDELRGPSDRAAFLSITASWHQFFGAHVVDLNDRAPR